MERTISEAEAAEFEEFQRTRREAEAELTLKKLQVDVSHRETDRHSLYAACDLQKDRGVQRNGFARERFGGAAAVERESEHDLLQRWRYGREPCLR